MSLTPTEHTVLVELAANAGVALTHEHLLTKVWGPDNQVDAGRMHTTIKNLRQKLGDNARNPRYITTIPHIGYRMPNPDPTDPQTPPPADTS